MLILFVLCLVLGLAAVVWRAKAAADAGRAHARTAGQAKRSRWGKGRVKRSGARVQVGSQASPARGGRLRNLEAQTSPVPSTVRFKFRSLPSSVSPPKGARGRAVLPYGRECVAGSLYCAVACHAESERQACACWTAGKSEVKQVDNA